MSSIRLIDYLPTKIGLSPENTIHAEKNILAENYTTYYFLSYFCDKMNNL